MLTGVKGAVTQPVNVLVDSSGNILWPTTLYMQNIGTVDWRAAITASPTPSATTNLLVAATNAALLTATNFTVSSTNGMWLTIIAVSNNLYAALSSATTAQLAGATNNSISVSTNFAIASTNSLWGSVSSVLVVATNNSILLSTNFTIAATNGVLVTATNFVIDATNALWGATVSGISSATNNSILLSTNFTIAATNSLAAGVRNAVYTNLVDYNFTIPAGLNRDAQKDTMAFARIVRSYGGPDLTTNRVASRIAAGLSHIYNTCGATSVVDAWFLGTEMNISSGTNVPTMRGLKGGAYNASYNQSGMWFNGVDTHGRWAPLPSNQTNSIAIRFASETNIAGPLQWLYSLQHTNGYTSGMHSSLGYQSATFYPWVYAVTLTPARAVFGTYYSGAPAEGAYKGMRQFRNVIITHDGVDNITSYVNGLYSTNGPPLAVSSAQCNEFLLGRRSDANYYFRGGVQIIIYFNRALTSSESAEVDWAMSLIADERPISVWGDSISYFDHAESLQGREWPQQMWYSLGYWTNKVAVHNFSISGIQAVTQFANVPRTVNRRPTLATRDSHAFVLLGFNDINTGSTASNTFVRVSNIWHILRTNGYTVHAMTLLPMTPASVSYTAAKASNIVQFNAYLLDQHLNAQIRPFDHYWNINSLITDTSGSTQLFDGVHPTNSVHATIGQFIASSNAVWLR